MQKEDSGRMEELGGNNNGEGLLRVFTNLSRTLLAWRRSFSRTALVLGSSQSSSALEQRLFEYNRLVTSLHCTRITRDRPLVGVSSTDI